MYGSFEKDISSFLSLGSRPDAPNQSHIARPSISLSPLYSRALSSAMLHQLVSPCRASPANQQPPKTPTPQPKRPRRSPRKQIRLLPYNANYQHLSYKIANTGMQVLLSKGLYISAEVADLWFRLQQNYRTFHHDALTAYITASIEFGCRGGQMAARFFGWDYVFTHPKTPQRPSNPTTRFASPT